MLMKEIWSLGEKPFPSMSPLEVRYACVHIYVLTVDSTVAYCMSVQEMLSLCSE